MRPPLPRRRRRSAPRGLAVAVAVVTALLAVAGWRAATADRFPTADLERYADERLMWVGPRQGPYWCGFDFDSADIVFVGDSRVAHALHLSIASELGLGEVALAWGHAALTTDLLQPLLAEPAPRSLVVALSPLGLAGQPDRGALAQVESMRTFHPACDPASSPHAVRQWAKEELEHLVALGQDRTIAAATLAWWTDQHRRARAAFLRRERPLDTQGLDHRLGHRLDRARCLTINPIEPFEWRNAWWRAARPAAQDPYYRAFMTEGRRETREEGARALSAALAELQARGWRIAAIRLPLEPNLRVIEDEGGGGELLEQIVRERSIPYRDFGVEAGGSTDGSHLNWHLADRVTRATFEWLHDVWGPPVTPRG